ncbi:XRE family transcriptional regulator [Lysobacter sp. TY2-98]|uniref:helix-turn-helix domain-containing protein n=1 Tax=Lysobacter sp. TY2-98 TaxID=2290922 RepID=UPI000E2029C2|nr:helix-turn-helix transcriptional regulator [Lysobacter sp. TY2-98]AXK71664.1 XRE family transcriptional regulator [Lysobacter sp. TY2-98]
MNDITDTEAAAVVENTDWFQPLAPGAIVVAGKHAQAALARTIGGRLREARELCNMSQSDAARHLGYANPSKLSKVESAFDTKSVPLWLLRDAATLYEVSVDFLLGLTDDWETGVPRGTQSWMLTLWEQFRQRDMLALDRVHREVVAAAGHLELMVGAVRELSLATGAYRERNPEFDDTAGSATLVSRLGRLEAVASAADVSLRKLKLGRQAEAF